MHEAPPDGNQEPDGESRGDDGPLQSGFVGLAQPLEIQTFDVTIAPKVSGMAHQGNPLSARIPDANDSTIVASALTWSRLSKTRRGRGGIESSNRCASMAVMLLISAGRPRMSCEIELRPAALRALKELIGRTSLVFRAR